MAGVNRSRRDALRLTDHQTLKLISLYEEEPVLWNPFLEQYRNRDVRANSTARIAKAMNVDGFGAEHVVIKIKNLRSSYCQELRKIAASEATGASRDEIYVPQVVWFSKMDAFLKPHVTCKATNANYIIPVVEFDSGDADNSVSGDGIDWSRRSFLNGSTEVYEHDLVSKTFDETDVVEPDLNLVKKEAARSPLTRRKKFKIEESNRHELESNGTVQEDETLDQFGKYLSSLIRALPRHRAFRLQQEIISLAIAANIENNE